MSSTSTSPSSHWLTLPVEIQLNIIQLLDFDTLQSLSLVSRHNHSLSLPAIYNSVTLPSFARLQSFLDHVPDVHVSHIRSLDIDTAGSTTCNATEATCSDALHRILSLAPRLKTLSLHLSTELSPLATSSFSTLGQLTELSIEPCQGAIYSTLSERTVVGIALAVPNLESLSISRIDRNRIPKSTSTSLSNLLSIPTLRHLGIHNTYLGHLPLFFSPADLTTDVQCRLDSLEFGAFENASPDENAKWCTRLIHRLGSHLRTVVLGSGINMMEPLSLPVLERVRLTPLFSPSLLPSTLRALAAASSSLRHIHVECLTVDLEDVCEELSECVVHVNGSPCNLKLRVFPALERDILADPPLSSECVPVTSLDQNAREALSRLEDAFTSAGTPISIIDSNVGQQADELQDWDDLTVVDEAVTSMEMKGTTMAEDTWVQVGAW